VGHAALKMLLVNIKNQSQHVVSLINSDKPLSAPASGLPADDPCRQCGACCAHFRVSFYWGEAPALGLPATLMHQVTPHLACMVGTDSSPVRCAALAGTVGQDVSCVQYANRPSPCREVQPGDTKCASARAAHDLPPLVATLTFVAVPP
jgi:Fe-S-cluster containining protein